MLSFLVLLCNKEIGPLARLNRLSYKKEPIMKKFMNQLFPSPREVNWVSYQERRIYHENHEPVSFRPLARCIGSYTKKENYGTL